MFGVWIVGKNLNVSFRNVSYSIFVSDVEGAIYFDALFFFSRETREFRITRFRCYFFVCPDIDDGHAKNKQFKWNDGYIPPSKI